MRRLSEREKEAAIQMKKNGISVSAISRTLRRNHSTIYTFFNPRHNATIDVASERPSEIAWRDLDRRMGTLPRDLTSFVFGDPLPGYSALERRA